jgi:hypothetical protein
MPSIYIYMLPISEYLQYNIYAYYKSANHIIFDDNLSYLLQHDMFPIKINNTHIKFVSSYSI